MKLSRIPGHERTVKHSFAFKESTVALLTQYQKYYFAKLGAEVSVKDILEQMVVDFTKDDAQFRSFVKQLEAGEAVVAAAKQAAVPEATTGAVQVSTHSTYSTPSQN